MEEIAKYFRNLTTSQYEQFRQLQDIYIDWNQKINLISRKDMDQFYLHHVLHSLVIGKWIRFVSGSQILDLGSGGGFPGIPLAILFPGVHFHLIDGTGKKVRVIHHVVETIGLENVSAEQTRAENHSSQYDFVVCRAVAPLARLISWSANLISHKHRNPVPNGLIALKGGDLAPELAATQHGAIETTPISAYFKEPFFNEKFIVYSQI